MCYLVIIGSMTIMLFSFISPFQPKREGKGKKWKITSCKFAHCVTVKDSVQMNTF